MGVSCCFPLLCFVFGCFVFLSIFIFLESPITKNIRNFKKKVYFVRHRTERNLISPSTLSSPIHSLTTSRPLPSPHRIVVRLAEHATARLRPPTTAVLPLLSSPLTTHDDSHSPPLALSPPPTASRRASPSPQPPRHLAATTAPVSGEPCATNGDARMEQH